ncbi:MAG: secretin N-terminal domain-containing protein [Phycisphaerales bacterium]
MTLRTLLIAAALTATPALAQNVQPPTLPSAPRDRAISEQQREVVERARALAAEREARAADQATGGGGGSPFGGGETISFEFPGGRVRDFITALTVARGGKNVNVVVAEDVSGMDVPAISLSNVSVESAVMALGHIADGRGIRVAPVKGGGGDPVYSISSNVTPTRRQAGPAEETTVLSLNRVTRPSWASEGAVGIPAATVLTAVESAIETASREGEKPPTMKFHKESGLLILKGTEEQLAVASRVVDSLENDLRGIAQSQLGESTMRTYPAAHTDAQSLLDVLRYTFPPPASGENPTDIAVDPRTNALVVKAPSSIQQAIAAVVRSLDRKAEPDAAAEQWKMQAGAMERELDRARVMFDRAQAESMEARAKLAEFEAMRKAQEAMAAEQAEQMKQARDKYDAMMAEMRMLKDQRDALVDEAAKLRDAARGGGGAPK